MLLGEMEAREAASVSCSMLRLIATLETYPFVGAAMDSPLRRQYGQLLYPGAAAAPRHNLVTEPFWQTPPPRGSLSSESLKPAKCVVVLAAPSPEVYRRARWGNAPHLLELTRNGRRCKRRSRQPLAGGTLPSGAQTSATIFLDFHPAFPCRSR